VRQRKNLTRTRNTVKSARRAAVARAGARDEGQLRPAVAERNCRALAPAATVCGSLAQRKRPGRGTRGRGARRWLRVERIHGGGAGGPMTALRSLGAYNA
jgi:hypothetical protein